MQCFNCQTKITGSIFKAFDKSFCSPQCRETISIYNCLRDPEFERPEVWMQDIETASLIEKKPVKKSIRKVNKSVSNKYQRSTCYNIMTLFLKVNKYFDYSYY